MLAFYNENKVLNKYIPLLFELILSVVNLLNSETRILSFVSQTSSQFIISYIQKAKDISKST